MSQLKLFASNRIAMALKVFIIFTKDFEDLKFGKFIERLVKNFDS